ncbi:hypothetical protein BN946_scf184679.g6 [Trametes cinnabarina]|uniref:F-box domain-containing protein n=1 Tax=Pycnoporus cinnabarinus TaxID=5643 RepID=A0A060STR2_PYCCI|nr:hypothetical protein BN946_scf184679.g6 [Trametes cinnabarina]
MRVSRHNVVVRIVTTEGTCIKSVGRPVEVCTVDELRKQRDNLRELTITSLPPTVASAAFELLQDGMPRLEQLQIGTEVLEPDRAAQETWPMLTFDLPPMKYPALRSLVLDGSAARLTPSLVSHLWRLVMKGGLEYTQRLPLAPFLDCISSFKCLEELELSYCFSPPEAGRPARPPLPKSRLMSVIIEERPATISQILSAVVLPSNAKIRLGGDMRGVSSAQKCFAAFAAMLPNDRRCLPILQHLQQLDVYHAPEACYITAKTDGKDILDLEIITDTLHKPSLKQARGELFEMMVGGLRGLFPEAAIERLSFVGEIGHVPRSTWIACLSQFPRLRELEVDDVDLRASPGDVIAALRTLSISSSPSDLRPICVGLESIVLYGDLPSVDLLGAIHKCLGWRKEHGGRSPLENLSISLYADKALPSSLLTSYQRELSKFGKKNLVEVNVNPGIRCR